MSCALRPGLYLAFAAVAFALFIETPQAALAEPPYTGFQASYYSGRSFQGAPLLTRLEPVINWSYDVGGSPAAGTVPSTDFSTRWEGWYFVEQPGEWTFTFTSDDGGRVWIDNELIIDVWYDHQILTRARTKELAAGYHLIRVEYYQNQGGMTSQLTITPPGSFPDWMGEYFDNPYLLGAPRNRVNNSEINFNWGTGSPENQIPPDNFSIRWSRLATFAPGYYTFSATADDGIRVWVGDTLVIDGWYPQQPTTFTQTLLLSGTLPVRVEYFEQGGQALVNVFWLPAERIPPQVSQHEWQGSLFRNASLTPPRACEQTSPHINFNWSGISPGCDVSGQYFSARWESTRLTQATGFYTIDLFVDDGARVFLDGKLVLDAWRLQAPSSFTTTVYVEAGEHSWRVEYFQAAGGSQISMTVVPGVVSPAVPLFAGAEDVVVEPTALGWAQSSNPASWRSAPNGMGNSALWAYNSAFIQLEYNWGRWYPSLPQARNYEVFVHIPPGIATTNNARYWIYHAGKYDSHAVAQAAYNNQWVSLGTYYFAAEGGEYVSLSDVTYECKECSTIVWDAIRFSPR